MPVSFDKHKEYLARIIDRQQGLLQQADTQAPFEVLAQLLDERVPVPQKLHLADAATLAEKTDLLSKLVVSDEAREAVAGYAATLKKLLSSRKAEEAVAEGIHRFYPEHGFSLKAFRTHGVERTMESYRRKLAGGLNALAKPDFLTHALGEHAGWKAAAIAGAAAAVALGGWALHEAAQRHQDEQKPQEGRNA